MPMHDWKKVDDGIFHAMHFNWIGRTARALNSSLLPRAFYALPEQHAGKKVPDILTLELHAVPEEGLSAENGGIAVMPPPPKATITAKSKTLSYVDLQNTIAIRHVSDHRILAMFEVVSRGNKSSQFAFDQFSHKVLSALKQGIHFACVDSFPPTRRDPNGLHVALWTAMGEDAPAIPQNKPLTAAGYASFGGEIEAFVEPFAVGDRVPDVTMYVTDDLYVRLPLEETYHQAFDEMPGYWREHLER